MVQDHNNKESPTRTTIDAIAPKGSHGCRHPRIGPTKFLVIFVQAGCDPQNDPFASSLYGCWIVPTYILATNASCTLLHRVITGENKSVQFSKRSRNERLIVEMSCGIYLDCPVCRPYFCRLLRYQKSKNSSPLSWTNKKSARRKKNCDVTRLPASE